MSLGENICIKQLHIYKCNFGLSEGSSGAVQMQWIFSVCENGRGGAAPQFQFPSLCWVILFRGNYQAGKGVQTGHFHPSWNERSVIVFPLEEKGNIQGIFFILHPEGKSKAKTTRRMCWWYWLLHGYFGCSKLLFQHRRMSHILQERFFFGCHLQLPLMFFFSETEWSQWWTNVTRQQVTNRSPTGQISMTICFAATFILLHNRSSSPINTILWNSITIPYCALLGVLWCSSHVYI